MIVRDIQEFVNKINTDLGGEFCNEFQYKRKELTSAGRITGFDKLFDNVKDEGWAINKGGGTEVQYHLTFDKKDLVVSYGLGFSAQYVPHNNEMLPVEYIQPYMQAFLELENVINSSLPDYSFIYGSKEQLQNPKDKQYNLFGKGFPMIESGNDYEIPDDNYQTMLGDLKKQFPIYTDIFLLRNKIIAMELSIDKYRSLLEIKPQIILQGPPGTGKTHTAKDLAFQLIFNEGISGDDYRRREQLKQLETTEQFKLIQFHPAYSYEDFVRGITAKSNGNMVEYKTENKILADFAAKALKNYVDSGKSFDELSQERIFDEKFEEFKILIENELDTNGSIQLTPVVRLTSIDNDAFIYRGNDWGGRLIFAQIKKLFLYNINSRNELFNNPDIARHVIQRTPYYFSILQKFREAFPAVNNPTPTITIVEKKKYILIIDEINRANLPAVLGELIYAMEYRGEGVKSMYELEGDPELLVLPPNLYIIGTMNTADRSIGHIDYAIRRRFAFIDILPNIKPLAPFALELFRQVSSLFIKNYDEINWEAPEPVRSELLASDFRPEDVWIGHSYFIATNKDQLKLKLEFEIKPILTEYIKDGILSISADAIIRTLHV